MKDGYRLHIENFLTIEDMDLDLSPGVQGFVGDNAVGKTNVLTAVESILKGKHDVKTIKDGEKRSEIRLEEISEGEVVSSVSRIQTLNASRLEGNNIPPETTPKRWLSYLLDEIAINPIRLISDDPVKYLKQHMPIKAKKSEVETISDYVVSFDIKKNAFEECDKACDNIKVDRLAQYQKVRHTKEVVDELKKDLPPIDTKPEMSMDDIQKESETLIADYATAEERNKRRLSLESKISNKQGESESFRKRIKEAVHALAEVDETRQSLAESKKESLREIERVTAEGLADIDKDEVELKEKLKGLEDLSDRNGIDLADLSKELGSSEQVSFESFKTKKAELVASKAKVEEYQNLKQRYDRVSEKSKQLDDEEARHKEFDDLFKWYKYSLPKSLIDRANLPVDGLEFREQELYVDDRHIDRLSSSERHIVAIKLSVAMAKAKKHIAICIDGIEIMDHKHRLLFLKAIKDSGIKVLYTRHGEVEHKHETLVKRAEETVIQ